jgi:hypothetical protein
MEPSREPRGKLAACLAIGLLGCLSALPLTLAPTISASNHHASFPAAISLHATDSLGSANDRHHRARGVDSTQVKAADRVLRVHAIVRPIVQVVVLAINTIRGLQLATTSVPLSKNPIGHGPL